jgi:hypothetical protein
MRTVADYRQLNDALFHAGTNSGSQFEWEDTPNRLHIYIVDVHHDSKGVLSYTVGVRSLDGAGPQQRGVALAAGPARAGACVFTLKNTGSVNYDIYRLSVSAAGQGWTAELPNSLAAVKFGDSQEITVPFVRAGRGAATASATLKAVSESDPAKSATASCSVR